MACTLDYIDFVCSQLQGVGVIRTRKMFGDWCIYVDEKPVILACDNLCYVKMLPELADMMNGAWTGYPYDGAKEHYILDIEHGEEAMRVVQALLPLIIYIFQKNFNRIKFAFYFRFIKKYFLFNNKIKIT